MIVRFLVIIQIFTATLSFAQDNPGYPPETEARIRQVETHLGGNIRLEGDSLWKLQERIAYYGIPGVSIAVIKNFKLDWARAYGLADKASNKKATARTLYQAASISKSINAVAALRLVQEKKIDLQADINQYLVSWKFPYDTVSKGKKISLANLLSHTAGLTIHGFPGYEVGKPLPTATQILDGQAPANTKAVRSQFAPQLKVQYSGGGTTISQLIISDVSKQAYADYLWQKVLQPMGMLSSSYAQPPLQEKAPYLATGYSESGNEITGKYHIYPEQGAAGLWTNPTDLSAYIIETELAYNGKSQKVLNQEYTRLRLTPYMDESAALGVFVIKKGGATYFQHGGSNEGFRCQYFGDVTNGNGVVVMVNSDNGGIINEIVNSVASVYDWKEFYQPQVRKNIAVADSTLNSYVGEYEMWPNFTFTITNKGGQLMVLPTGEAITPMYASSPTKFFVLIVDAELEFVKGPDGKVEKLLLHQNGNTATGKKIK